MKLTPIVARLKGAGLKRVYGALELAGLEKSPVHLPAYFVIREAWDASPNRMQGIHHQQKGERFGVVIMLAAKALREDGVSEELSEAEGAVIDALAGWVHPEGDNGCSAAGGRHLTIAGSTASWIVSFTFTAHIRKAPS